MLSMLNILLDLNNIYYVCILVFFFGESGWMKSFIYSIHQHRYGFVFVCLDATLVEKVYFVLFRFLCLIQCGRGGCFGAAAMMRRLKRIGNIIISALDYIDQRCTRYDD